ncbi:MAG: Peptidoglycan glycosyltransferase [Candidatus Moranbacteria bacterium GW2011_GWE2_35_2-]|nr:MAG: Peptidoglycan glycosyltransferase [Candidatus Moranbacteria bacterium GW2011_GWE2_35_2-]KKQ06809.1 MAG: Peptidoglycan glycosyltransferase [Candidatus Moranbacteria bacterium GW2011_GWF1_36_4]KKQ22877.1 MAG: Peptidoglycan glycosyltransferase [Candidatus Moranbacteria bacterium GW2011_GWF2_37_11]KKQ29235.1 MAG: Peptidoglycan glycosyltransferase [Candidatus Moranbacteria bacterium GW2011_GWD1_37_17]KKQ30892.1 MAG: Peptidoglycan glycosyltransferase [Candidatus Moranbacteria bacterium GW2011
MTNKKYQIKREILDQFEVEDSLMTLSRQEACRLENPFNKKLLDIFWFFLLAVLFVMAGRVFYLNIVKGEYYREIAKENSIRSISIKAPRGKIYDRYGKVLVNNTPSMDVVAIPADLPAESSERRNKVEEIAKILAIDKNKIWEILENVKMSSLSPILVKENINQEESLIIEEKKGEFPGFNIEKNAVRRYEDGFIFSHILGYEGKIRVEELKDNPDYVLTDYIGKQGIEKAYEEKLRGKNGARRVEVDSMGRTKREFGIVSSEPGSDLILNIDAQLQKKLFDSISSVLEKNQLKTAAAVAMSPNDGGILAMVSIPSFDNNLFASGISLDKYQQLMNDPFRPMFNRALSGEYAPGSTIKPLLACAALREGIITEQTQIESRGGISVGSYFFGDWKTHGFTDVRRAIAVSSDVFFYSVGGGYGNVKGLGMEKMKQYYNLFGFGSATGIDIPGEAKGFIPDENWKLEKFGEKWYIGNSYHASIGQGYITATPLQIAAYISVIANGGTLYQPRIVSQARNLKGETENYSPRIIRSQIIDSQILKVAQEGMKMTITEGTAQSLKNLPMEVAGKTGTAQYGGEGKTHGWFASYAPYEKPEIVLVVLVEGQGEESYNAVPVVEEVYRWYWENRMNN